MEVKKTMSIWEADMRPGIMSVELEGEEVDIGVVEVDIDMFILRGY